jgi:hypothetical protein
VQSARRACAGPVNGAISVGTGSHSVAGDPATGTDFGNLALAVGNDPTGHNATVAAASGGNFNTAVAIGNPGTNVLLGSFGAFAGANGSFWFSRLMRPSRR